jgi:large subunit ribosomal protein L15
MKLHALQSSRGFKKPGKRLGRGRGSGKGTYSGKGIKGQKSRTGYSRKPWFEGGQTPLIQKIPKLRGFNNINRIEYAVVNVRDLEKVNGKEITLETLKAAGLVRANALRVKLLSLGEAKESYTVKVQAASEAAKKKIEAKGGTVELVAKA